MATQDKNANLSSTITPQSSSSTPLANNVKGSEDVGSSAACSTRIEDPFTRQDFVNVFGPVISVTGESDQDSD